MYLVSLSCDRTAKIHSATKKGSVICNNTLTAMSRDILSSKHVTLKHREYLVEAPVVDLSGGAEEKKEGEIVIPQPNIDPTLLPSTPVITPLEKEKGPEYISKKHQMFVDENLTTFFRRPAWSPDGNLLLIPTGLYRDALSSQSLFTTYVYIRGAWNRPVAHIPSGADASIGVKFSPKLYKLNNGGKFAILVSRVDTSSQCMLIDTYENTLYTYIAAVA